MSVTALSTHAQSDSTIADTTIHYAEFKADREAKAAVYNIVRYSGLTPNFTVIKADVPNAVAYIKGKKRYIGYNPQFIAKVQDKTNTDWAAISILAHEIGHHLLGHTIKMHDSNPGDELSADKYSGFILYQMGATLEEAKAAMEFAGNDKGSDKHPPKAARLKAIADGWLEARFLDGKLALDSTFSYDETYGKLLFQCNFSGDENLYFVNEDFEMMWYNNYGNPIVIGMVTKSLSKDFQWDYHYNNQTFSIDSNGIIWNVTTYGAVFKVGTAVKIEPQGTAQMTGDD